MTYDCSFTHIKSEAAVEFSETFYENSVDSPSVSKVANYLRIDTPGDLQVVTRAENLVINAVLVRLSPRQWLNVGCGPAKLQIKKYKSFLLNSLSASALIVN